MFYAPWCGWSKRMQPVVNSAAKLLGRDNPLVRIARMDHAANDHPLTAHVDIDAVPKLFFFKKGQKDDPELLEDADDDPDSILSWLEARVSGLSAWRQEAKLQPADEEQGLLKDAEEQV